MLTFIAYSALFLAFISGITALIKYRQLYWLTAAAIYVFSLIAGFSIGQFTVGLTFVFIALALGNLLGWDKGKLRSTLLAGLGLLIGAAAVLFVDDAYLFFPIKMFF